MAQIGVLALGRPTFDVEFAESLRSQAHAALSKSGHEIIGGENLLFDAEATETALSDLASRDLDLILILQVTFTDASMTVKIAHALQAPLAIWAFPEPRLGGRLRLNAFCGLNLAAHALGLNEHDFAYAYGAPDRLNVSALLESMLRGGHKANPRFGASPPTKSESRSLGKVAVDELRGMRIGRIGAHPEGFDTCRYNGAELEQHMGVSVDELELDELFDQARSQDPARVAYIRSRLGALDELDTVDPKELDRSLALQGALKDIRDSKKFDAFAIRCWPETFTEYGGAVCGPVGMMGEARVPCACEADVLGALTNLLAQNIAGKPPFLVDLVDLDAETNTGVVWHCGQAPISMADPEVEPKATIHSNRKMPLLFEFPLKPGQITLARISQARGKTQMFVTGGTMMKAPLAFSGTAGVFRPESGVDTLMSAVMDFALEHHTTLVYGDHAEAFVDAANALSLPVLRV